MTGRKIIQVENGFQVWQNNALIAMLDSETDTLKAIKNGVWYSIGTCYRSSEILRMLDEFKMKKR